MHEEENIIKYEMLRNSENIPDEFRAKFEEALEKEWQDYVNRGAATVDSLEDNLQKLSFAKGFLAGCIYILKTFI